MNEKVIKLTIGALLHDIGKAVYRSGHDRQRHSLSGSAFLEENGITDKEILDCVRFHHAAELRNAPIEKDSLSYVVYLADNIASAADRRKTDDDISGFDITVPLKPVFNLLNGNRQDLYYSPLKWNVEESINYPTEQRIAFTEEKYDEIIRLLKDNLNGMEMSEDYLNSLLELMEAAFSYIPSSTAAGEQADISLFDHSKLTAAAAVCIYYYLAENEESDFQKCLYENADGFYRKDAFLLGSLDFSGIQKFIYTITSKDALKTLRSRSFYLELMMEHIIDMLLQKTGLSRSHLIYAGGGHCYLLLPNTAKVKEAFEHFVEEQNEWLLERYQTALYLAGAYTECSAYSFQNQPAGSYAAIYRAISEKLSEQKASRYSAEQIRYLNSREPGDYTRECRVCRAIGNTSTDGICPSCLAIQSLSKDVLYQDVFVVNSEPRTLELPGGQYLEAMSSKEYTSHYQGKQPPLRVYGKNVMHTGNRVSAKLWVGDYTKGQTLEQMAESDPLTIDRIAVLRADVDDLGQSFVAGFKSASNNDKYVTLSRTASLSRQLSLFFKLHINKLLESPKYTITGDKKTERNATIVYSGGDDLFIVGQWLDVIELAIDIRRAFAEYSENMLSISAGIGIYEKTYPFNVIAEEVAEMESRSKGFPGKNAVTLLEDGESHQEGDQVVSDGTYRWDELENEVIGVKFRTIADFFDDAELYGNSFLYRILELIRNRREKINFARLIYLLSRMEPNKKEHPELYPKYIMLRNALVEWVQDERSVRQLKTAILLYVYMHRQQEQKGEARV